MKAIRINEYGNPSVLKLYTNLTIPKPKENEVLIRVRYAGVNPCETYTRDGKFFKVSFPWTPGHDCSGTIVEIDPKCQGKFSIGQRVYTTLTIDGSYTSHALVSINHVHALPDKLSFQQGAALPTPYYTAYQFLFQRGDAKAGETVLIHGASGCVGIAAIQLAKNNNMIVIGTAGTIEGLEMIKKIGADYAFNHREEGYAQKIKEQFGGKINLILEMLANQNLVTDCELAAKGGRIMIIGSRGTITFDPIIISCKSLDIRGDGVYFNSQEQWAEADSHLEKLMENGVICPVIAKEYDLVDAPQAHHDVIFNSGTLGKLVLKI